MNKYTPIEVKAYMDLLSELDSLTNYRRVVSHKTGDRGMNLPLTMESLKREINFIKNYGKRYDGCMCKLWRRVCSEDTICFSAGGAIDHVHAHRDANKKITFISEPYIPALRVKEYAYLEKITKMYGLKITIDPEQSSWYPGSTTAIVMQAGDRTAPHSCMNCTHATYKCKVGVECEVWKSKIHKIKDYSWCTEYKGE